MLRRLYYSFIETEPYSRAVATQELGFCTPQFPELRERINTRHAEILYGIGEQVADKWKTGITTDLKQCEAWCNQASTLLNPPTGWWSQRANRWGFVRVYRLLSAYDKAAAARDLLLNISWRCEPPKD